MSRNRYAVARRSIWYVLKTLLFIAAITALCLGVFIEGMYVSNFYVLATEGLELRAECILKDGPVLDLTEYFTEDFVNSDGVLYDERYGDFTVTSYDYRLSIENVKVLPWNARGTMRVVESLASVAATPKADAGDAALPEWPTARYIVSFTRKGSRWYISSMTLLEVNPEVKAKPTPDMSLIEEDAD